jgi:hypothetical protein
MELIKHNNSIEEFRVLSPKDYYDNLKCTICNQLCNEPRLINCCDRLVCKLCITERIGSIPTCPVCGQFKPGVLIPNRFITRLFDNLRVRCSFAHNGCNEAFSYHAIQDHERKCKHNDTTYVKCGECGFDIASNKIANHNCIRHLSQIILDLNISELSISRDSCFLKCPIDRKRLVEEIINNLKVHEHLLQKSITTIYECDICGERYHEQFSWHCRSCDFDMCIKCFEYSYSRDLNIK